MQIVIDISEDVYTRLFDNGIQDNEIAVDDVCEMARALRLGTPIPKGHGDLIDRGELLKQPMDAANYPSNYVRIAKAIIEADKEYKAEVITRGKCMMCGKELTEGLFFCKECGDKANSGK